MHTFMERRLLTIIQRLTVQRRGRDTPQKDAPVVIPHSKAVGVVSHPAGAGGLGGFVLRIQSGAQDALCPATQQEGGEAHIASDHLARLHCLGGCGGAARCS